MKEALTKLLLALTLLSIFAVSGAAQQPSIEEMIDGPGYYFPEMYTTYDGVLPIEGFWCVKGTADDGTQIECPKDDFELWGSEFDGLEVQLGGPRFKLKRTIPDQESGFLDSVGNILFGNNKVTYNGNEVYRYEFKQASYSDSGIPINERVKTGQVKNDYVVFKTYKHLTPNFPVGAEVPINLRHEGSQVAQVGPVNVFTTVEGPYLGVMAEKDPQLNDVPVISNAVHVPPKLYQFEILKPGDETIDEKSPKSGHIVFLDFNPADNLLDLFSLDQLVEDLVGWTPIGHQLNMDTDKRYMMTGYRLTGDGWTLSEETKSGLRPSYNFNEALMEPFKYKSNGGKCPVGADENCNVAMRDFTSLTQSHTSLPDDIFNTPSCQGNCPIVNKGYGSFNPSTAVRKDGKSFKPEHSVILGWEYTNRQGSDLCPLGTNSYFESPNSGCDLRTEVHLEGQPPLSKPALDGSTSGWNEPKYYVCYEGFEALEGKVVYSPNTQPSQNPQSPTYNQFRCDPSKGEWISVSTCNDGVDNDGDGKIDAPGSWYHEELGGSAPIDTKCTDITQNEREISCSSAVIGEVSRDFDGDGAKERDKVALWGLNPSGSYVNVHSGSNQGCRYSNMQKDVSGLVTPPDVQNLDEQNGEILANKYYCDTEGGAIASHPILTKYNILSNYPETLAPEAGEIMKKYIRQARHTCTQTIGNNDYGNEMLAAIIQVPEPLIPYGTEFAGQNGYQPVRTETVRQAENRYFNNAPPTKTDLKSRGLNETVSEPYEDISSRDVSKTWVVGNYVDKFNDKIKGISVLDEEGLPRLDQEVFEGGFAGNCPPNQHWGKYAGKWQCKKDTYHYVMPDISEEAAENSDFEVGVRVPFLTLKKLAENTNSYESIKGNCWSGSKDDKPASEDSSSDFDFLVDGEQFAPYGYSLISANLEERETGQYTCNFTVYDKNNNIVDLSGSRWTNLWDAKGRMDEVSQVVTQNSKAYNLEDTECSNLYGLPCDTFINISTYDEEVGATFFGPEQSIKATKIQIWRETEDVFANAVSGLL